MLTLITTYYNQPKMLKRQQETWETYPEAVKIIVVDDGSSKPISPPNLDSVSVLRIHQDIPWNQDQARNLAMRHATGFCLLLDLDHVAPLLLVDSLLNGNLDEKRWYRLPRVCRGKPLKAGQNILLLHSKLFALTGGYPPSANYGSDRFFLQRLKNFRYGGVLEMPPLQVLLPADINDAATKGLDRTPMPVLRDRPIPYTWEMLK